MFTLQKENLHHAYLIESDTSILSDFLLYLESLGFATEGNPDVFIKQTKIFTIDDAREIKNYQAERAVTGDRKIICIVTEYLSHQSQHALLKVLEEPASGVHFFLITPVISILLPTLRSRLIALEKQKRVASDDLTKRVHQFLKGEKEDRLTLVNKIIKEFDKEETSTPLKVYVVGFLDELEVQIAKQGGVASFDLETLWKVKDYIHDQGSSVKNLLEVLVLTCS